VPDFRTREEFERHIEELLDGSCLWRDEKTLNAARRDLRQRGILDQFIEAGDRAGLRKAMEEVSLKSRKEQALDRISEKLQDLGAVTDPARLTEIRKSLRIDPEFLACFPAS
jgi:hypothetical protein